MQRFPIRLPACRLFAPGVSHRRQRGFSLIEVSIVTAIVLLIAIMGIPAIGSYVVENKVPKVGEEMQRFVARVKANAQGAGPTPYASIHTGTLANAVRDSSIIASAGTGPAAVLAHGLGGNGTPGNGTIMVAPASVAAGGIGSGFSMTFSNVNSAACPSLATVMQRVSEVITVQGQGGAVVVKDGTSNPAMPYDALLAASQCGAGDANTFVFVAR